MIVGGHAHQFLFQVMKQFCSLPILIIFHKMPPIHISDEILCQIVPQVRILFKTLLRLLPPQINMSQISCSPNVSHLLLSLQ